jgi:beta-glucanase (GH16 family)
MKKIILLLLSNIAFSQLDVVYSTLVWSDEFSVDGAISAANWHHQTQLPAGGNWFNNEAQHYTNRTANSYVSGGLLNIVAKKEAFFDQGYTKQYTSARLNSKFAFKYGRVDVRAKIPVDPGTWPAIWMLGKNVIEDGAFFSANYGNTAWPACGEIDIMEHGITPGQGINYIQAALHTPSSFGNTNNIGGVTATDLANNYHIYSMNWSPFQISFLLDNVIYYTYNPVVQTPSNWPFTSDQYLLLNIAMGGVAGNISPNYNQSSMLVDYVRVYQNTAVDTQIPTNFVATVGTITNNSIEILVNGNDNSGNVVYSVTYNGITTSFSGVSGVQKSYIISGLNPNTNYTLSVSASDLAGNNATNNAIILNATTFPISLINTQCDGTDTVAQQGSFSTGYKYGFQTIGTDVKFTFELLDTNRVGVVAYLWKQSPFTEYSMTNTSGLIFTKTLTGFTAGSAINYAVKFAYANGLSVTKYFAYTVGNSCLLGVETNDAADFYFQNPVSDNLKITSKSEIDSIEIYNLLGNLVLRKNFENNIDVSNLPKGIYLLNINSGNKKSIKKIIKD